MAKLTPIRAIRKKCLDCCCGQQAEVRSCMIKTCALYPYNAALDCDEESITESS